MDDTQTRQLARDLDTVRARSTAGAVAAADRSSTLAGSRLLLPLLVLLVVLLGLLALSLLSEEWGVDGNPLAFAQVLLGGFGVLMVGFCIYHIEHHMFLPLARLRRWAMRMRGGDLSARVPVPFEGEFAPLATDLMCLCEEFKGLKADLDAQVAKQTERLAQKNASLKILYDVAASINRAANLDQLLLRFLRVLKEMVGARSATVQVLNEEGQTRLMGSITAEDRLVVGVDLLPVPLCRCGKARPPGDVLCGRNPTRCSAEPRAASVAADIERVSVPLAYQNRILGRYDLYVSRPGISGREDILELLTSIGSHLGMAVEKARLDRESRHISIIGERNTIANELHDSLAQTLASTRFQTRVLEDVLELEGSPEARRYLGQLRKSLDEAHTELRELMTQFRAPLDDCGLVVAIEKLAGRFRRDTGIGVYFQHRFELSRLPADLHAQVIRIVQESLANVRKHSGAGLVRVLLRGMPHGDCMVLVEDNGVGFRYGEVTARPPGEHIGLTIMAERARQLGGDLRIESEPGEGTRVELTFRCEPSAVGQVGL